MWPRVHDRRPFLVVTGALVALMWTSLWLWGHSPYGRFLDHEQTGQTGHAAHHHLGHAAHVGLGHAADAGGGQWTLAVLFVAGWTLMTVAMMLPTSLPFVALFHSFVRARPNRARLTALLVLGYLGIWTAFGLAAHLGASRLDSLTQRGGLQANAWAIGAGTVLLAGAYQFSPLKDRCLEKCRSPLAFLMEHWHGGGAKAEAVRLGVRHGLYCLGCCWSLMLLMFAVGVGSLGWMLALGAVMAAEKNAPWGRRLTAPLGAVLLVWGIVLVATQGSIAGGS